MNEKKTATDMLASRLTMKPADKMTLREFEEISEQYAAQETAALRKENERLKYWLKELLFFYENNSGPEYHQFSIRQIKELIADLPTEEPQLPQSESEP